MHRFFVLLFGLSSVVAAPVWAGDWQLHAVFGDQVVLSVDGERAQVGVGETGPGGVRVLRISGGRVLVEAAGERRELQVQRRSRSATVPRVEERGASLTVHPDSAGDYAVTAGVNGQAVIFVLDAEIEAVLLRDREARRAGLDPAAGRSVSVSVSRAQGRVVGQALRVEELRVGPLGRRDVPVIILADADLPRSRLGQAFLDAFTLEHDGAAWILHR